MQQLKTKVCIVGSGIAGCLCAKYLSSRFDDILIVERGAPVSHQWRLRHHAQEIRIPTAQHSHTVIGPFTDKKIQYVYALGGSTNHWMGNVPRFLPNDFRMKSIYGVMLDWPIQYDDLEPYYCLAEEELSVAGASDNPRIPRSRPYPLAAHPFSPADLIFKQTLPAGSVVALPQARPTKAVGDRPECCGSATCGLCPVDSKYTVINTHLPQLNQLDGIRILTRTAILSLETDGSSKVKRANATDATGKQITIEADVFVLAANAIENPSILLRSSTLPQHPHIGKFLFDHSSFTATAILSRDCHPNYGNSLFTAHCYAFYDGQFRANRGSALGEIVNKAHLPIAHFVMEASRNGLSGAKLHADVREEYRKQLTMNFLLEDLPQVEREVRIGKKTVFANIPESEVQYTRPTNYVENARLAITQELPKHLAALGVREMIFSPLLDNAGHLMGTCRMGNESEGVVDANLRYHKADNLYVLGGSAFPTYSASNPTLTIAALAIRLGNFLKA